MLIYRIQLFMFLIVKTHMFGLSENLVPFLSKRHISSSSLKILLLDGVSSYGKISFLLRNIWIFWRGMQNKLPTDDNLWKRSCICVSMCNLCANDQEIIQHLFYECKFAIEIWNWFSEIIDHRLNLHSLDSILSICYL